MKLRIISLVIVFSCLAFLPAANSLSNSNRVLSHGTVRYSTLTRLHTDGAYIKNEYGQIVQLTGFCWMDFNIEKAHIDGPQHGSYLETIDWRINRHKELGVNCIRISMNQGWWVNGGMYGVTPEEYQAQLDRVVEDCQKLGIYVYFCLHLGSSGANDLQAALMADNNYKHPSWTYGWLDFVKLLTDRYDDYSAFIGLQIWAEPAWGNETDINVLNQKWANFSLANARAIHSVSPEVLVFVTSPAYYLHKWVSDYYFDNPLPEPNVVYAWQDYYKHQGWRNFYHSYEEGNYDLAKQQMEQWFYRTAFKMVNASIAPVIYAETGWNNDLDIDPVEDVVLRDTASIFSKYKQSWTLWVWWGGGQPYDLLESDWYSLSPYGQVAVENLALHPEPSTS